jgi:hypothetical protein
MHTQSCASRTLRTACILTLGASSLVACSSRSAGSPDESVGSQRAGDTMATIYDHPGGSISCMASDGTNVYVYDGNYGVVQVPIAGGPQTLLMSLPSSSPVCEGMTVADHHVLWITSDTQISHATIDSALSGEKLLLAFPPPRLLGAFHVPSGLAANPSATDVYFVVTATIFGNSSTFPVHCTLAPAACSPMHSATENATAIGSNVLYVGNYVFLDYNNTLYTYSASPAVGGPAQFFGSETGSPQGNRNILTDGTSIYWGQPGANNLIDFVQLQNPSVLQLNLLRSNLPFGTYGLAADSNYIYSWDPAIDLAFQTQIANPSETSAAGLSPVYPNLNVTPPLSAAGRHLVWVSHDSDDAVYTVPTP